MVYRGAARPYLTATQLNRALSARRHVGPRRRQLCSALVHGQYVARHGSGLAMQLQLEPVRKQCPKHEFNLMRARCCVRLCFNIVELRLSPRRTADDILQILDFVSQRDEIPQRAMGGKSAWTKPERQPGTAQVAALDGCDSKHERSRCGRSWSLSVAPVNPRNAKRHDRQWHRQSRQSQDSRTFHTPAMINTS